MEKIIVMAPGHELWDGTIAFAAGCPWRAGAFLAEKMRANDFESNERVLAALHDDEVGLYEKYSFTKVGDYKTIYGSADQLFSKTL